MQHHAETDFRGTSGRIAGVDGCRAGWIVATRDGVFVTSRLTPLEFVVVGVDMPIGLPDSGPRACDQHARRFLGARRSTVFPTPPRVCLGAPDHAEAVRRSRLATGSGISIQAFHLLVKIAEMDSLAVELAAGGFTDRLVEIHPECAFATMNGGTPLQPKRNPVGRDQRRALLHEHFGELAATPRGAESHDLLDAYAVLWSAERFVAGTAITFGDGATDAHGNPMRIVA